MRRISVGLLAGLVVALAVSCKKSEPPKAAPASALASDMAARIHWLGKKRLATETNAAHFMDLWQLPESVKLEAQTLDKLSVAPWRLLKGEATVSNAPVALLRTLLNDVVQEESYTEVRAATNQPGALIFAIHLNDERAGLWETNLAAALESLTGLRPTPAPGGHGWSLKKHDAPNLIELTRAGEWTIVGMAQEHNTLLADAVARIQRDHAPVAASGTNFWVDAALDLHRLAAAFPLGWSPPVDVPQLSLNMIGHGAGVRTHADLDFPKPFTFELDAWNVPTNLIHDPLVSFTAIRGIRPWLKTLKVWNDLELGTPPNQAFLWAQEGSPALHFIALPSSDGSNQVSKASQFILRELNPLLTPNRVGRFEMITNSQRLHWQGIPLWSPTLDDVGRNNNPFVVGGWFSNILTNRPLPAELLLQLYASPNLVGYDWEVTQPLIEGWVQMGQLFRLMFGRPRLSMEKKSFLWLRAIAPRLGNSVTTVKIESPTRLSFVRDSSIGLGAIELHVLADWLEGPSFPQGFYTLQGKSTPPFGKPPTPPKAGQEKDEQ